MPTSSRLPSLWTVQTIKIGASSTDFISGRRGRRPLRRGTGVRWKTFPQSYPQEMGSFPQSFPQTKIHYSKWGLRYDYIYIFNFNLDFNFNFNFNFNLDLIYNFNFILLRQTGFL